MSLDEARCRWAVDARGLKNCCSLGPADQALVLQAINRGIVAVYNVIWNHFSEANPDEATSFNVPLDARRRIGDEHRSLAGLLATSGSALGLSNLLFSKEFYAAAICRCDGLTIITEALFIPKFYRMLDIDAVTVGDVLPYL